MTGWRKSSHSGASNCAEAATGPGVTLVRDSADRAGPVLAFTRPAWEAFTTSLRRNDGTPL